MNEEQRAVMLRVYVGCAARVEELLKGLKSGTLNRVELEDLVAASETQLDMSDSMATEFPELRENVNTWRPLLTSIVSGVRAGIAMGNKLLSQPRAQA